MSIKLRYIASLPFLAACSENGLGVGSFDAASNPAGGSGGAVSTPAGGSDGAESTDLTAAPQTAPTLETGVDQAALAAAVRPQILAIGTQPSDFPEKLQLGRPWGEFDVHKGPRLVFRGSWLLPYGSGGDYTTVAEVGRDGDSYKLIAVGFAPLATLIGSREQIPAVSAALDRGRAGFLRCVGEGGNSLLAYEAEAVTDAGQAEIRVQPLGGDRRFQGIDASAPWLAEMSLDEFDPLLPAE
jgi:hypothetical protein